MGIKRKAKQPNSPPSGEAWAWQTATMLASPAWRAMSINARRALDRIMLEHMAHAGTENGNLIVTHRQFIEAGVSRDYVADALDELVYLHLISFTARGRGGTGTTHASQFLLTWLPEKGSRFCDDPWRQVDETYARSWQKARKTQKRKRTKATKTQSREGVKNHFPTPQTRTVPLRNPGVARGKTATKGASKHEFPTPHSRSTINILGGRTDTDSLKPISELLPAGWCKSKAQSPTGTGTKPNQIKNPENELHELRRSA